MCTKIILFLRFLIPVFFSVMTCSHAQDAGNLPVIVINSGLKQLFEQQNIILVKERTEISLEKDGDTIQASNCKSLTKALSQGYILSETVINQQIASEYQICYQLKYIKVAQPSTKTYFSKPYGSLLINKLDLQTLTSSLKQQLSSGPQTLKKLNFKNIKHEQNSITIDLADWYYHIKILARGDFNHDGLEDLLIEFIDQAMQGNYFSHSTLILERKTSSSYINVSS